MRGFSPSTSSTRCGCSISPSQFRALLDEAAEVIEEVETDEGHLKELVLSVHWSRPLHVVVVDDARAEERLITVYEPSTDKWSDDFRRRR